MNITIFPPTCIYKQGMRSNNEDYIYPIKGMATDKDKLFIVCDGLGGHIYGEIASKLACEAMADFYFGKNDFHPEEVLLYIEKRFSDFINLNSDHNGMATTLVYIKIDANSCTIGWVGDSRVYHVRDGKILFETQDHSLVNVLIKQGEITKEEAKYDYRKNIITNVISGNERTATIDYKTISRIKSNDFFMLCSDGIFENIDNTVIEKYLVKINSLEYITESFLKLCDGNTSDNYSMYLIKVK